jgi:uncharacterized phage protein gp47/JayE
MSLDIPRIVLDPADDEALRSQAFNRIRIASDNRLTDFSPGSPVAALVEGQVFAQAELSYFLGLLPEALALEVFRLAGPERSEGTRAVGELTFLLTKPISNDFFIPIGYRVNNGDLSYVLTESLNIPAGALSGTARIQAIAPGSAYNLPAYSISQGLGLTHLQSVYNATPISGGTDLEPLDLYVRRASRAFRYRGTLVSKGDYERAARELLPPGFSALAVPFLSSDRLTEKEGHVHIFILDPDSSPATRSLCAEVQAQLADNVPTGMRLWVSPAEVEPLELTVVLKVNQVTTELADRVYKALARYISPSGVGIGKDVSIDDLRYQCRTVAGVERVLTALVGPSANDRAMPNSFTQATIGSLSIDLTDGSISRPFYYGSSSYIGTDPA